MPSTRVPVASSEGQRRKEKRPAFCAGRFASGKCPLLLTATQPQRGQANAQQGERCGLRNRGGPNDQVERGIGWHVPVGTAEVEGDRVRGEGNVGDCNARRARGGEAG